MALIALALVLPLTAQSVEATTEQAAAAEKHSRDVRWREDLDALWMGLRHGHPGALDRMSEQERQLQISALDERVPELSDDQLHVEAMRFVASFGDDHTVLELGRLGKQSLPLSFVLWPDGLRLVAVQRENQALVGQQVVRVGAFAVDDVILELARVQSMSEQWRIRAAPQLLIYPRLLHAIGLIDDPLQATFTLRDDQGKETVQTFAVGSGPVPMTYVKVEKDAVTNQRGGRWHHADWLTDKGLLYVQYNRCATSKEHDLAQFTDKLVEHVEKQVAAQTLKALVIDLQYNTGGDSRLGDLLFARLAGAGATNDTVPIFCLIGPSTFSSALLNAERLQSMYGAVLIGTPTGGAPDHFGEVRSFELPHSKAKVFHSTKRFGQAGPRRTTLKPDIHVERTFADFLGGRDPLLDAVQSRVR